MDELVKRLRQLAEEQMFDFERQPYLQAADAIEELQSDNAALNGTVSNLIQQIVELRMPRWIPVTERLPDFEGCVLCMMKAFVMAKLRYQEILYYDEDGFRMRFEDTTIPTEVVTHWMPLPQPPEEG